MKAREQGAGGVGRQEIGDYMSKGYAGPYKGTGVVGKPLSIRQMEIIQQVGLSLILILMVIVIKNDLTRLPFFQ